MAWTPDISPEASSKLASFASPDHLDPQLQSFLGDASERLCQWFSKASSGGPLPCSSVLPEVAPNQKGLSPQELLNDLQLIMDGAYQPSHPGALAHLDPPPLTASIAAELICAGLNNNLLAEELSPSLSRLERQLCQWFVQRLGMSSDGGGVAASGGTISNLMALVIARQQSDLLTDSRAVVLTSFDSHVSLAKAIRVMGLPTDSLQKVKTNSKGQLSIDYLEDKLKDLKSQGKRCLAIVATAGTTVRGAVDPLVKLGKLCKTENIWLHVDAAIGGVFALSNSTSSLVDGIRFADSISLNPQKLLGIAKTSSLLLVANRSNLSSVFSTGLPYIEPSWGEAHGGEMGLQGTRPAEVLKLWLGLRQLGEEGIVNILDSSIQRRFYLQSKLISSKLSVISGPLHLLACVPANLDSKEAESWSIATRNMLLEKRFMVSRPIYQGCHYIKVVLGNPHTSSKHLDELGNLLNHSV